MGIGLAPSGGLHQAGACTKRRLAPSGGLTLKFRKLNVCGGYDLLGFYKKKAVLEFRIVPVRLPFFVSLLLQRGIQDSRHFEPKNHRFESCGVW